MPPVAEETFRFNRLYKAMFTTECRYIDLWGGRGRGGSHTGTAYFLHLLTYPAYFRGYMVRQIFGDLRDSLFRDMKDRIAENKTLRQEDFAINDHEMRIVYKPTGNMITSKGVKSDDARTAKMKSLAGATHVLIEEAEELGEEDFDQLDLSLRTVKALRVQIIRIFNPPGKTHWIWRDYVLTDAAQKGYFTATPKTTANLLSIFSTYHDNLASLQPSTVAKFESFREKKPEYYYTIVCGLVSEGMRGRIFSGWRPMTNQEFNEIDAMSVFGQDFGTSKPAALIETKLVNDRLYVRELNYLPLSTKEIALLYCGLRLNEKHLIIGDSAEPLTIAQLRRGYKVPDLAAGEAEKYPQLLKGWNIHPAFKGPGSIAAGISKLKGMEVYVTEDSRNVWEEYANYKWALDKNKNPTDEPIDDWNHCADSIRMCVMAKGRFY
jgi:phage terminase large subunit